MLDTIARSLHEVQVRRRAGACKRGRWVAQMGAKHHLPFCGLAGRPAGLPRLLARVRDGDKGGLKEAAFVGERCAGDEIREARLAGPVGAHDSEPIAKGDAKAHWFEEPPSRCTTRSVAVSSERE